MGTEVFRPQDCLNQGLMMPIGFSRRRCASQAWNPTRSTRKPMGLASTRQKGHLPRKMTEDAGKQVEKKGMVKNLPTGMTGQGIILKREQSLRSLKDFRPSPCPASGLAGGVSPGDIVTVNTEYAGPAFSVSPCPSSLPLPSFSVKKCFEDSATKDLRRLLRLD